MDSADDRRTFVRTRLGSSPDPPGWMDGAPTSGIGQSCAFCGTPDVAWVHPLARDLLAYREYGTARTLPTFWALCDRCEAIYASGDDGAAVEVMRASEGRSWSADEDLTECIRNALVQFRRADLGSRRFDPEPLGVIAARKAGFVPVRELTGVAAALGPLWPAGHRLWLDELGPGPDDDEDHQVPERWMVRSPWPSMSVGQTLAVLWRWVERDPFPDEDEAWKARIHEAFGWSESEALAFLSSES